MTRLLLFSYPSSLPIHSNPKILKSMLMGKRSGQICYHRKSLSDLRNPSSRDSFFSNLANRFLCHVTLSEPETFEPRNNLKRLKWTPSSHRSNGKKEKSSLDSIVPIMFGATCLNGFVMKDMGSEENSIFFVFPDLSVRIQGEFRICINLIDLEK